jgi:hypothetical protein
MEPEVDAPQSYSWFYFGIPATQEESSNYSERHVVVTATRLQEKFAVRTDEARTIRRLDQLLSEQQL